MHHQSTTVSKEHLSSSAQVVVSCSIPFQWPSIHPPSPAAAGQGGQPSNRTPAQRQFFLPLLCNLYKKQNPQKTGVTYDSKSTSTPKHPHASSKKKSQEIYHRNEADKKHFLPPQCLLSLSRAGQPDSDYLIHQIKCRKEF